MEELVTLLQMRAEAEQMYSDKLFDISDQNHLESIREGLLAQEVDSFKSDCRQKAKAAAELSENISQDCVQPLQNLIDTQDGIFKLLINESRLHISSLDDVNNNVRSLASRYFECSENAEKFIHNYQELKFNIDVPLKKRQGMREGVLSVIETAKKNNNNTKILWREQIKPLPNSKNKWKCIKVRWSNLNLRNVSKSTVQ